MSDKNTHPQAVYNLECRYDGHIPQHMMDAALAIDAEYLAQNQPTRVAATRQQAQQEAIEYRSDLRSILRTAKSRGGQFTERMREDFDYYWGCYRANMAVSS